MIELTKIVLEKVGGFFNRTLFYSLAFVFFLTFGLHLIHVQAQESSIGVMSSVQPCVLEIYLEPGDRDNNDFSNQYLIDVRFLSGVLFHSFSLSTDTSGKGVYNFCSNSAIPIPSSYNFYIKGASHLRKAILNVSTFNSSKTILDFRTPDKVFIAGEIGDIVDNKINSLDISSQIKKLNTADLLYDLNRDGVVNLKDLQITRKNFFKIGD
ncbi:hypothetical protein D6810_02475 [Candidatus Dojkabacteria bacterium]|uniref:Dockerin domain-containing protein n=1 Tax=Candidatus Dojkabacteria bacterium TaxID=2099670 RepID=A0A3M0YZ32_9BACT|nr:MAG: hypothetical protein D6810_02475 [Candidatus Dojkabacteria bacterium]